MSTYLVEYYNTREEVKDDNPDTTEKWEDQSDEDGKDLIKSADGWVQRGYGIATAVFKDGKLEWASDAWHKILDED